MKVYNSKEVAALLGCTPRHIREMCKQGLINHAYQVPGKRGQEWRIPADSVAAMLSQREVEVDVLEPEDAGLVARETLASFVLSIIEPEAGRNKQEIEELRQAIQEHAETVGRNKAEIAALRQEIAELREKENRSFWKRLFGR